MPFGTAFVARLLGRFHRTSSDVLVRRPRVGHVPLKTGFDRAGGNVSLGMPKTKLMAAKPSNTLLLSPKTSGGMIPTQNG